MSLSSVMQTALTGISAAKASVAIAANNLANSQTAGFKASQVSFATQTPQTQSPGDAPTGRDGGTNPVQVGSGVRVAAVTTDFTQGSIAIGSNPLDLALQGDGFFILEGSQGEQFYSRNGQFSLNAASELVSSDGRRVLGFAADEQFQIETSALTPLRIQLGKQVEGSSGSAATLTGFSIDTDGTVRGRFSDGVARDLGQIGVARFANPSGLQHVGGNLFAAGPNSGLPVVGKPGQAGLATITPGATELSNTDSAAEMVSLFQASSMFRANLLVIGATDELFGQLINLPRRSG